MPDERDGEMTLNVTRHFSERSKGMRASEVRELLKLLQVPDMISFAGGFPNPETFPAEIIREIVNDVLKKDGGQALQYGITEGYAPLRECVAERMRKKSIEADKENVLIVSGSQQVIDLMGKIFIDPGDTVVISAPTYLTALTGFGSWQATFESIPIDANNMRMDIFEDRMKRLAKRSNPPEIVYALPNFQNPAGVTMPEKNRKRLVDLASDYDFIILEDDPYGELRYVGEHVKPIKSFDDEGRVVYCSTFSKVMAPGLRVGWVVADPEILKKLIISKQSADVCTNVLGQRIAHEYVVRGQIDPQIEKIKKAYKRKMELMLQGMDEFMPEGIKWIRPEGGMFLWVELPESIESDELLKKALKKRVAFVTGKAFYADPRDGLHTMRLNFTHPADDMITEGMRRLGSVVNQEIVSKWDRSKESEDRKIEDALKGSLIGKS
ncbi:MAG: PLP-dependent aminotransferase family protein [Thermoplasmata archaeon]|jgi:2-aminoadipate transaminase|nr:PLP-dependent aminotransferase family protein [Thermoplasmata archaeon]